MPPLVPSRRLRTALGLLAVLLLLASACRKKPTAQPPPPPPPRRQSLFLLLPEQDHPLSAVVVTNQAGAQMIDQPYHVVRVADNATAPAPSTPIDPAEVNRRFGDLLSTMPSAAETFAVNFDLSQGVISAESRPQIALIVAAIQNRRSTSVTVIGHTDTTGEPQANYTLGLQRAEAVATEIRAAAPAGARIFVASHGESDPAVRTADGVDEPRNRRVEVIVR